MNRNGSRSRQGVIICVRQTGPTSDRMVHPCAGDCGQSVAVSAAEAELLQRYPGMEIRCLQCAVAKVLAAQETQQAAFPGKRG